jgi:hypothetical protein
MTIDKIVAIHQPNFFPWLGFFNKIARADTFILLDDVQFPKTGGNWINHVRILVNGQEAWITVPIIRAYHGVRKINEIEINETIDWREKLLKTFQANYGRAPFYGQIQPFLKEWLNYSSRLLVDFNLNALFQLVKLLDLSKTELVLQSKLGINSKSTEMLIELTQVANGTAYLCGGGADGYQEDDKFSTAGVELIYQNFCHPIYSQKKGMDFVPGLSVLDALMFCGIDATQRLVKNTD